MILSRQAKTVPLFLCNFALYNSESTNQNINLKQFLLLITIQKMRSKIILLLISISLPLASCSADDDDNNTPVPPVSSQQRIKITFGENVVTARIYDNATSRDFIAQLPLTIDMEDYAGAEKIFYPPQKLSTADRQAVGDPAIGDINVYAPWGNIAIFYKNYSGSRDLIRIGRIEEGMNALNVPGKIKNVKLEVYQAE